MHTQIHTHILAYTYTHMYILCTYIYICIYVYIYKYACNVLCGALCPCRGMIQEKTYKNDYAQILHGLCVGDVGVAVWDGTG